MPIAVLYLYKPNISGRWHPHPNLKNITLVCNVVCSLRVSAEWSGQFIYNTGDVTFWGSKTSLDPYFLRCYTFIVLVSNKYGEWLLHRSRCFFQIKQWVDKNVFIQQYKQSGPVPNGLTTATKYCLHVKVSSFWYSFLVNTTYQDFVFYLNK